MNIRPHTEFQLSIMITIFIRADFVLVRGGKWWKTFAYKLGLCSMSYVPTWITFINVNLILNTVFLETDAVQAGTSVSDELDASCIKVDNSSSNFNSIFIPFVIFALIFPLVVTSNLTFFNTKLQDYLKFYDHGVVLH